MRNRFAFTMLELVFVIVIMGIIGKFGVEFLAQAYNGFIYSKINNELQSNSGMALESIGSKLQFRIKDSVIGRVESNNSFEPLGSAGGDEYNILEWVGSDVDGYRGNSLPFWSGIIDLDESNKTILVSPETNTTALNDLIETLSHNSGTDINDSAIYLIGSDSNIHQYGWTDENGNHPLTDHNSSVMHPIKSVSGHIDQFESNITGDDFSDIDIYEYYQFSWTAYAVALEDYNDSGNGTGNLYLYYDYQPWHGEDFNGTESSKSLIMKDVSTFRFKSVGSIVKIQVCVKSDLIKDYSLCKEKTIF